MYFKIDSHWIKYHGGIGGTMSRYKGMIVKKDMKSKMVSGEASENAREEVRQEAREEVIN